MSQAQRRRILFVAEAVTLAHVARPLVLAQSLDPAQYEIHFASAKRFELAFEKTNFRRWEITSTSSEQFLRALAGGSRLYDYQTLANYVEEDLRVIGEVHPDLIIGDFRLSLAVSAAVAKIPYAALINAYWSPYTTLKKFPLPDVPAIRIFGYRLANFFFHLCQPTIFAYHARPLNRLRTRYGLQKLGNLLHVYSHGDYTLYADPPDFFATTELPANHRFLGPIDWSPNIPLPSWWNDIKPNVPVIYVNLGSSGPADLLPAIAGALANLQVTVILATAGRYKSSSLPPNIRICDYVPGNEAAQRASQPECFSSTPQWRTCNRNRLEYGSTLIYAGSRKNGDRHAVTFGTLHTSLA